MSSISGLDLKLHFNHLNHLLTENTLLFNEEHYLIDFLTYLYSNITYKLCKVKSPKKKEYPSEFISLETELLKEFIKNDGLQELNQFFINLENINLSELSPIKGIYNNDLSKSSSISCKLSDLNLIYTISDTPLKIINGYQVASSSWEIISDFIYLWYPNSEYYRSPNRDFIYFFKEQCYNLIKHIDLYPDLIEYIISKRLWKFLPDVKNIIISLSSPLWATILSTLGTNIYEDEDPSNP